MKYAMWPLRMSEDHSQTDTQFASDLHDFRELLRTHDQEGLISALENPEFYRLACDDDRYFRIALQGVAALAWDMPEKARDLFVHFDVHRARDEKHSYARETAGAIMAALEWRQLAAHTVLPMAQMEQLHEFLQLQPALADDAQHGASLRSHMRENPQLYVNFLDALATHGRVLPEWITQLSSAPQELLGGPVSHLSEAQVEALSSTTTDLRRELARGPWRYILAAIVLATMIALPNATGVLICLLLLAGFFAMGERKSYEQIVRPRLVHLAIDHGVGATDLVSWIYKMRGKSGRMGQFDIKIENDQVLDLLAAVSRAAGPQVISTTYDGSPSSTL